MRVLLIEDEKRLAAAIHRGLEAEGFTVDVAFDGLDGLWQAQNARYDVIVLDIMLPGMNGYRICSTLREAGDWTPILMLTAKDGELDEAEALDTGADDFLSKPFSFVVLTARLRALTRRGMRERPVVLTAGDLTLNPAEHSCRRGDETISLTPREFSILEYLLRRPGEVVPKKEILSQVWDFAFTGDPNIVEVNIANLRKKVDAPFDRRAIETVRGVGYRVAADGG
jgi:DNA-binding response OmpR family regulator